MNMTVYKINLKESAPQWFEPITFKLLRESQPLRLSV